MAQICILTTVHSPLNTRVYHKEARAAVDAGHNVAMIAHDTPTDDDYEVDFYSIGTIKNRFQRWSHIPRIYATARSMDADIYHFHDPELLPIGVLLSRQTGASIIYDAHEDYGYNAIAYREWIPSVIRPSVAKVFPWWQSALANRLDAIITTTESIAEQFRELGHHNVNVIHNYPKTNNITFDTPPVRPSDGITLVYVGTLEPARGLFSMLKLIKELTENGQKVELWALGTFGKEKYRQQSQSFIEQYGLENNIEFLGFIPYENIFSYLKTGDIGLCLVDPNLSKHALPTKIFEYLYSKTPVLSTDAIAIRSYITDSVGQLVEQNNHRKQANIIQEWCSNPQILAEMGSRGREVIEQKYNWQREASKLQSIYKSLI